MSAKNKRRRMLTYGSNTLVSSLFFIGILIFVALIAERHPWRVDLTESGAYSLSEKTRNILKSLDKPIQIKAFFSSVAPEQSKAKELLETYRYYSKNVNYELIDPDREPDVARRYEVRTYGTLVVEGFDKKQAIQTADEEAITNAIFKLSRNEEKKVYFLKGHGERSLEDMERGGYSSVKEALQKENYVVEELSLLQQERTPEDAALIIVAGPEKKLFDQELNSLKAFLGHGGKLMVLLDPFKDSGMDDFLKGYGIEARNDIVIDKLSRVFGGSYLTPVVMEYGQHKISQGFGVATFYPEARSIVPLKDAPQGVSTEIIASTSENAWAETNITLLNQGEAAFDEKEDSPGPVPLVAIAQIESQKPESVEEKNADNQDAESNKSDKGDKSYLLVAGDSNFIDNANFGLSGNGDFFLNMVNFLAEEEHLITIEPSEKSARPLLMTQPQGQMLFWLVMVLTPLLVLLAGFVVFRIRRSQR